jgi:hypothetical protein
VRQTLPTVDVPGPEPLLELVFADLDVEPTLTGFCAGFEAGRWRATELARHLFEWLPDFALTPSERDAIGWHNAAEVLARAARNVYATDDHKRRGEFGELLLHAVIRQHFNTVPAINKVFFKDGANETVKGFDAVHVVVTDNGGLELWLGEAKFYGDLGDAIRRIADDLVNHTEPAWLRGEFIAIGNKIDPVWPHAGDLRALLHRNRSLDQVFTAVRIPALVSYDSAAAAAAGASDDTYREAVEIELRDAHRRLLERQLPPVTIHLLLVPLADKAGLVEALDRRLRIHLEL